MIDDAIARETMTNQNLMIFWVNNLRTAADILTKLKGDSTVCTESGLRTEGDSQKEPADR